MWLLLAVSCDRLTGLDDLVKPDTDGLVGLLVAPEDLVVPVGGEVQLVATGLYADRSTQDLTAVVMWGSDDPDVAAVSEDLDAEGTLSGVGLGETRVWASLGGVTSNTAGVTVTDATLLGLVVEPDPIVLAEGQTLQLSALAAWSDGTRGDAAAQVRWITDDGGVAQIASGGVLTAAGSGETTIRAQWDDVASDPVPVTVSAGATAVDLRVARVQAESGGGVVTLSVTVANDGDVGAGGFWVDAWLDEEPDFGGTGDDYVLVDWVGPGSEATVTLSLYPSDGAHAVWVSADTNFHVEETDEDNNTASIAISTGSEPVTGPNLEITYFDWIADGYSIYWYVDVTNTGSEDVGAFFVDLFVDRDAAPELYDDGDTFTSVTALSAGDTAYADFLLDTTCWACWSWVLIDGYDAVEETDEDDNVAGPLSVSN